MSDLVTGIGRRLTELKVITCCSRYQVRGMQKAVDRKTWLLMAEYRRKAQNRDRGLWSHALGLEMELLSPLKESSSSMEISFGL